LGEDPLKLLIQPDNGIKPLLEALKKAKKRIRILIFRFDRVEIEKALVAALGRGVDVQALIAYTNQGEEKNLRRLEMRLLAQGITVTRTATGSYTVIKLLPSDGDDYQYRIKSSGEAFERVAKESQLDRA